MVVRALEGFFQGPIYPSFFTLANKWIPSNERSSLLGFLLAGMFKYILAIFRIPQKDDPII